MIPIVRELQSPSRTTYRSQASGDGENDEKLTETPLKRIFNAVLDDCASLRHVVSVDEEDGICSPKESFVCILVRNALCITRPALLVEYVLMTFRRVYTSTDCTASAAKKLWLHCLDTGVAN